MNQQPTFDEIVQVINSHVESEAEKSFQTAVNSNDPVKNLLKKKWELGKPIKEGTDIEKMLHQLIYMSFSKKAKLFLDGN